MSARGCGRRPSGAPEPVPTRGARPACWACHNVGPRPTSTAGVHGVGPPGVRGEDVSRGRTARSADYTCGPRTSQDVVGSSLDTLPVRGPHEVCDPPNRARGGQPSMPATMLPGSGRLNSPPPPLISSPKSIAWGGPLPGRSRSARRAARRSTWALGGGRRSGDAEQHAQPQQSGDRQSRGLLHLGSPCRVRIARGSVLPTLTAAGSRRDGSDRELA